MSQGSIIAHRRLALGLAILLGLGWVTACGPDEVPPETGLRGGVLVGPMCPVVQMGTDCPDRPLQADLEVTRADRRVLARSRSDLAGKFEIPLAAGTYVLVPVPPNPGGPPYAAPIPFTVTEGEWTALTVQYDSGIR